MKNLTERAAKLQEQMAGDGHHARTAADPGMYISARDELDAFSRELQAKGVTEEDIEHRAAVIANPRYRPPHYLGSLVVDLDDDPVWQDMLEHDYGMER